MAGDKYEAITNGGVAQRKDSVNSGPADPGMEGTLVALGSDGKVSADLLPAAGGGTFFLPLFISSGGVVGPGVTSNFGCPGADSLAAANGDRQLVMNACTITGMRVRFGTENTGDSNISVRLHKNSVLTALMVTQASGMPAGTVVSDTDPGIVFADGDLLSIAVVSFSSDIGYNPVGSSVILECAAT